MNSLFMCLFNANFLAISRQKSSCRCSCCICEFFSGSWISLKFSFSVISTVSTTSMYSTLTDSSSSKQTHPNSCPAGSDCFAASGHTSNNRLSESAKVFFDPMIHCIFRLNCSSSTAQLFTFAFMVCFVKNFFKGRWSHFIVTSASAM